MAVVYLTPHLYKYLVELAIFNKESLSTTILDKLENYLEEYYDYERERTTVINGK